MPAPGSGGRLRRRRSRSPRSDQRSIASMPNEETIDMRQIDHAGDEIEEERLLGVPDGHRGHAQQVVERDHRDERRILQEDQPEIGEAGQREADELRQDDQPHRLPAVQAERRRRPPTGPIGMPLKAAVKTSLA